MGKRLPKCLSKKFNERIATGVTNLLSHQFQFQFRFLSADQGRELQSVRFVDFRQLEGKMTDTLLSSLTVCLIHTLGGSGSLRTTHYLSWNISTTQSLP